MRKNPQNTLENPPILYLSREDALAFLDALHNPPPLNAAMQHAIEKHHELLGDFPSEPELLFDFPFQA